MRRFICPFSAILLGTSLYFSDAARAATHQFDIPAENAPDALSRWQKQCGIGVLAKGADVESLRFHAVRGSMDDQAALRMMMQGSPLFIERFDGKFVVIVRKSPKRETIVRKVKGTEDVFAIGYHNALSHKRASDVVVDSIAYDPIQTLGGASSIAQSLVLLPGVTAITDGDEPRYVSLRGISPDLNHTSIDGIALATVGENGTGARRVNLQNIPSDMTARTDIYKSFTAEQDAGAIGGVVDLIPMSAYDHKGFYKFIDADAIYSTLAGIAGKDGAKGGTPHWGQGVKGIVSDQFGKDNEFGIVLSGRYQYRVRNSSKTFGYSQYYNTAGQAINSPALPGWNGLLTPSRFQSADYSDAITNVGGSGRFEWRPTRSNLQASVMGWAYRRGEGNTGSYDTMYTNSVTHQTGAGGREKIGSVYLSQRTGDTWQRDSYGVLGHLEWRSRQSLLSLKAGYTWETYANGERYLEARTYPTNQSLTYGGGGPNNNMTYITGYDQPGFWNNAVFKIDSADIYAERAIEKLPTARLDYSWNTGKSDRGFGVAAGFEWREMSISRNASEDMFNTGQVLDPKYFLHPDYTLVGFAKPLPVINVSGFPFSTLPLNAAQTAYYSGTSDYAYQEDLYDGYVSLRYRLPRTVIIAGVRTDAVNYTGWTPQISNSMLTGATTVTHGGYLNPLPSVDVIHHFPYAVNLHASFSMTVGRPNPSQLAAAEYISCGNTSTPGSITDCSISMGNPNLRPRRAKNFDISVDKYFNNNNGFVSLAFFDKWIKDDIYTLSSFQTINNQLYTVNRPENANGSTIMGLEFSATERNIRFLHQVFDLSANATWMNGSMQYMFGTQMATTHSLINQPTVLANGAVTWKIPQIDGGLRVTANYSGGYVTSFGATPGLYYGFGSLFTMNLAFWHRVIPHLMFKYELMNVADQQPYNTYGYEGHVSFINQYQYYGRGAYFHVIFD
ncbi:TonB-dependent receptor [Gluconacetobacter tumulicola]|uniref:TonB-dependent receptor n=2 Tax=Gluconacetobacter TaxID=89583 RepID=A0A7W4P6Z2_9PROT|nr:TonB-dependent receptor [Gluconacetobacter tumulicola]MBB2179906.1 TonB-dependent receptor [Gluconacetobacter tumulicola]